MQKISRILYSRTSALSARSFSSNGNISIDLGNVFKTHRCDAPSSEVTTNKNELLEYYRTMYTMRRMEITADTEYKARTIRGFCHLYDGQEAIAVGMHAAMTLEDSICASYRCHCLALLRGSTVEQVLAELFGFSNGSTKGKGGSMHYYSKKNGFFGGSGIVGAQVPCASGLAFANKYNTPAGEKMPIACGMYGDGAANQGQIWEVANMSALWKLPMAFVIENNKYGMGTSTNRSSSNDEYYTMGGKIPGIRVDGMNILAVRQAMTMVKDYMSSGNGPMYVEMDTYRYHGHSMSDPGTTYRTREEVGGVRNTRDPIDYVKKVLLDNSLASEADIKAIEKEVRVHVEASLARAKAGSFPPKEWLYEDVYATPEGKNEKIDFIRMPDYTKSIRA